jgi:hypothetical protein
MPGRRHHPDNPVHTPRFREGLTMTDMPMTSPSTWGKGQPKNLKEALASVRSSLTQLDGSPKPKGNLGDHVAAIQDAAEELLSLLNDRSSGQTVRARVGQFDAGTRASVAAIDTPLRRGDLSLGPVAALLGSVQQLGALAQNL